MDEKRAIIELLGQCDTVSDAVDRLLERRIIPPFEAKKVLAASLARKSSLMDVAAQLDISTVTVWRAKKRYER